MGRKIFCAAMLLLAPLDFEAAYPAEKHAEENSGVSIAMDFLSALGRLDFAPAGAFLAEDAVLDLPFAGKGMTVKGREEILRFFQKSMTGSVQAIDYKLEQAYPSSRSDDLVMEISTRVHAASGLQYTNRLVTIFAFRRGKITLFREYFNPVAAAK